jgi:hypothetical protein
MVWKTQKPLVDCMVTCNFVQSPIDVQPGRRWEWIYIDVIGW